MVASPRVLGACQAPTAELESFILRVCVYMSLATHASSRENLMKSLANREVRSQKGEKNLKSPALISSGSAALLFSMKGGEALSMV